MVQSGIKLVIYLRISAGFFVIAGGGCNLENGPTYDIVACGIPTVVSVDYIDLSSIEVISKFRSSEGHDYSDDFEHCRSMKHYFQPKDAVNWTTVSIYSPVDGTINKIFDETMGGKQIIIQSVEYPAFYFREPRKTTVFEGSDSLELRKLSIL